jgi:hypothetical protein
MRLLGEVAPAFHVARRHRCLRLLYELLDLIHHLLLARAQLTSRNFFQIVLGRFQQSVGSRALLRRLVWALPTNQLNRRLAGSAFANHSFRWRTIRRRRIWGRSSVGRALVWRVLIVWSRTRWRLICRTRARRRGARRSTGCFRRCRTGSRVRGLAIRRCARRRLLLVSPPLFLFSSRSRSLSLRCGRGLRLRVRSRILILLCRSCLVLLTLVLRSLR